MLSCKLSVCTAGCHLFPMGLWVKRALRLLPSFPHPSLLIQPKHLTKDVRWRSPGSVGDQSRFSENKRSLEEGKADVIRRGRLALKTWQMQKKKKEVSRALAVIFTVNHSASGLQLMADIPASHPKYPSRKTLFHQIQPVIISFTSLKSKLGNEGPGWKDSL